jgi:hypothetical protein
MERLVEEELRNFLVPVPRCSCCGRNIRRFTRRGINPAHSVIGSVLEAVDLPMQQTHRTGEKLFVDYAGHMMPVVDPSSGEIRAVQLFMAVSGVSNDACVDALDPDAPGIDRRLFVKRLDIIPVVELVWPEMSVHSHCNRTRAERVCAAN